MSDSRYFNITNYSARERLAMMRRAFEGHAKKYPYCPDSMKPKTWRDVRRWGFHNWQSAFCTLHQGAGQWYSHHGAEFRDERDADDIVRRLPRGWYTDNNCDETAIGIVARLTHGRFIAGYRWTSNDERVYYPDVFDDENEAACMADEHARCFAESSREDSERFDAMVELEGLCESKESDLREALDAYRAAWAAYLADPLRHAKAASKAAEWVRELISDLRAFRREFEDAKRAYENGGR